MGRVVWIGLFACWWLLSIDFGFEIYKQFFYYLFISLILIIGLILIVGPPTPEDSTPPVNDSEDQTTPLNSTHWDTDYPERPEDDWAEWNREHPNSGHAELQNRFIQWARSVGESEETIRAHIDEMLGLDMRSLLFFRFCFAASSAFSIREPLEAAFSGLRGHPPNTSGISPDIRRQVDDVIQLHRSGAFDCGPDDPEWRNFLMKKCRVCERPLRLSNSGQDSLDVFSFTPDVRAEILKTTCNPRRHSDSQKRISNIPKPRKRVIPPREAVEIRTPSRLTAFVNDRTRSLRRIFRS
jgi:hypothetical protein